MGSVGDAYDDRLAESFFPTLQRELLDEHRWTSRRELALAVFEWIECWYDPSRRHSSIQMLSPADCERAHTPAARAAWSPQPTRPPDRGKLILRRWQVASPSARPRRPGVKSQGKSRPRHRVGHVGPA